jgi:hypothetical protein
MEDKKPDIERLRLEFEKEKWQTEVAAREREFVLREREQANRDADTELKRKDQATSKWRSPLVVAVFAAAIAGVGNAGVAALNGWLQRDLESRKRDAERVLEETKAESSRVLEMIKTGDTEIAAKNIQFLLETGLVAEVGRANRLREYLANRKPGTGPALPAPTQSGFGSAEVCGDSLEAVSSGGGPDLDRAKEIGTMRMGAVPDLADRVIAAMKRKKYVLDRGPGEVNIIYVEGMDPAGTANPNEPNKWNDLRLVIRFERGKPKIIGSWAATTEPGRYFTEHPVHPAGVARIEFGQYKAWQVGIHRNHEGLVQTGGDVSVCRDQNKDGLRTGDRRDIGRFGINQHWGYDLPEIDNASAGSLAGQSTTGHRDFMAIVKSDPRYQADPKHVFATTILRVFDVLASDEGG